MELPTTRALTIAIDGDDPVSALLDLPPPASPTRACFVFAHGAGAGMDHPFMAAVAQGLARRGIATLRFQVPYRQRASKRPDPPRVAHAAVRAAVAEAARRVPNVPLFAGGKSFGGRMSSQAQADSPLPAVRGIVFVGFPLHPAGTPSVQRADHLSKVACPMLFLQGTRDALADLGLIRGVVAALGDRATLQVFDDADHSFHVRVRSGNTDAGVLKALVDGIADWIGAPRAGASIGPPANAAPRG